MPAPSTKLKFPVFFVPFFLLTLSVGFSMVDMQGFLQVVKRANDWILASFGDLFSGATLLFLGLCLWAAFSPLGRARIGGSRAKPLLTRWQWFSISLCTTIAIGILFWAAAEPMYHLHEPPRRLGLAPASDAAARFALSTMFLHWTFTPYGIYTVAGLTFALAFYNLRQPFSLGSMLTPLLGARRAGRAGNLVDAICLYSLVAGMATSLGAGMLIIAGGVRSYLDVANHDALLALTALAIIFTYVASAVSGLMRGVRVFSHINIVAFVLLALFVLFFGPTIFLFSFGWESLMVYVRDFFPRSAGIGVEQAWSDSWTIFYWANWMAWAPVTAAFLGRLSYGYTVRDYIVFNLLLPAFFSMLWMTIFSGAALHVDHFAGQADLFGAMRERGPESAIYLVLGQLPAPGFSSLAFLFIAFISFVTAADSNTSAMSGLCASGISPDSPEPPAWIKVAWGLIVGAIAYVMVANAGIEGIKMTSVLGGLPALFFLLAAAAGLIAMLARPGRYLEKDNDSAA
jgi:glycine betaine transporter